MQLVTSTLWKQPYRSKGLDPSRLIANKRYQIFQKGQDKCIEFSNVNPRSDYYDRILVTFGDMQGAVI